MQAWGNRFPAAAGRLLFVSDSKSRIGGNSNLGNDGTFRRGSAGASSAREKGITMIYKIRTELEEGIKLLAEAEDALKGDSIDAARLSMLEQLSSATDAMLILRKQAA